MKEGSIIHKKLALFLTIMVVGGAVVPVVASILLGLMAVHALRGPRESVEALGVLAFGIAMNKVLVPIDVRFIRWIILAAAASRVLWDTVILGREIPPILGYLTAFFSAIFVLSSVTSMLPAVSMLKAVSFYVGVGTILVSSYRSAQTRQYWHKYFYTLTALGLVGSIPLYFMPEGFARASQSFQGVLSHPQTFGIWAALLTAFAISFSLSYRVGWFGILTACTGLWGVFMSDSRTGMMALVVGGMIFLAVVYFRRDVDFTRIVPSSPLTWSIGLVILIPMVVVAGDAVGRAVWEFLSKGDRFEGFISIFMESRGKLIRASMENFRQSPLVGIGLGVPSDLSNAAILYGPLGIPIQASVEKGFAVTALLEEIGVFGAMLFAGLLWKTMVPVVRVGGDVTLLWISLVALMVNAGEAIIFSIGGNGLIVWLVVGLAHSLSVPSTGSPVRDGRSG